MSVELAGADTHATPDDLIGQVLANRYQIELRLGEGAMGAVFKAKHVKVGRPFAVKVLHNRLLEDAKVLQRFEREAELAGRLRHPNVVGVVDVGETADGFRYMVMDFAEGSDLAAILNEAPMPAERIIHLTRQMLEGLYHAHEQGLIHRDFKPENVIIERDDHGKEVPRIVDFGIAILREGGEGASATGRLTTNGLVLGTPHYMAPEQAVADPIDHRIDLFALGIVIYEMLCGKLPFDGSGAEVARANLLLDPPLIAQRVPFLEVDPLLEAFARRLMAKKREMRPATAKAARELLDLIVQDPASAAAALGVPYDAASTRGPAVTQPTTPIPHDPPEEADSAIATAPSARHEAPAYPMSPVAPEPARRGGEHAILTHAAVPLGFGDDEVAPPKRRGAVVAAALGAVVVIAIVIFAVSRGGEPPEEPAPPTKVVMQSAPPKPDVIEAKPPPPPVEPAIEPPIEPPTVEDPPVVVTPKRPEVKRPAPQPELKKPPVTVPEPPTSPPAKGIDASALYSLYVAVGTELATVAKSNPPGLGPIANDYRRIQIQVAMASPDREKYATELASIRKKLETLKSRQR